MLNEIKRYTHTNSFDYGVATPQEAFNREQDYLREKRVKDELLMKSGDDSLTITRMLNNLQKIVDAVHAADAQIKNDNRTFIILNNIQTNEIVITS